MGEVTIIYKDVLNSIEKSCTIPKHTILTIRVPKNSVITDDTDCIITILMKTCAIKNKNVAFMGKTEEKKEEEKADASWNESYNEGYSDGYDNGKAYVVETLKAKIETAVCEINAILAAIEKIQ